MAILGIHTWQFFVTFLGWLSDLSQWLSDLQLRDKKATLNHLVATIFVDTEKCLVQSRIVTPRVTCSRGPSFR